MRLSQLRHGQLQLVAGQNIKLDQVNATTVISVDSATIPHFIAGDNVSFTPNAQTGDVAISSAVSSAIVSQNLTAGSNISLSTDVNGIVTISSTSAAPNLVAGSNVTLTTVNNVTTIAASSVAQSLLVGGNLTKTTVAGVTTIDIATNLLEQKLIAGQNVSLVTTNGITTISASGSGGAIGSESDTLSTVTARGSSTSDIIHVLNTTDTTSETTGAFVVAGGVGIAKDLQVGGDVFSFNFSVMSDARLKSNVRPIINPLTIIESLVGKRFAFNNDLDQECLGFIAQEVEAVLPELVTTGIDDFKSVNYTSVIPVLVEAIKILSAKVTALQNA